MKFDAAAEEKVSDPMSVDIAVKNANMSQSAREQQTQAQKFMTGKYDFKVMRRLTTVSIIIRMDSLFLNTIKFSLIMLLFHQLLLFLSIALQIENKFLDALCGFYHVDDEDELPAEIREISLGEMFEEQKSPSEMREKMVRLIRNINSLRYLKGDVSCPQEQQLTLKPWDGMGREEMLGVIDEVMEVLTPLVESAQAAADGADK